MKEFTPRSFLAMTLVLTVGQAYAAAPTVGLVMARNTIRIDSSPVRGNATVFNGNVLESAGGTSELRLNNGGSVHMAPNARVRMFQNVAELQSGKIQMSGAQANANQIRVEAAPGSSAILDRNGNTVIVGSLRGSVRVTNKAGVLLASINPGHALAFGADPQATGAVAGPVHTGVSGAGAAGTGSGAGAGAAGAGAGAGAAGVGAGAAGAGAAAGAAGASAGFLGLGVGALAALGVGAAAAVGIPVAVAATRSSTPVSVSP